MDGASNPADDASRGLSAGALEFRWLLGPPFLRELESSWPEPPISFPALPEEFKVPKRACIAVTKSSSMQVHDMNKRLAQFSSMYCLKKAVAWILRQKGKLLKRIVGVGSFTVDELSSAEIAIIKAVQWEYFSKEMFLISSPLKGNPKFLGPLQKLNPICVSGIL